MPRSFEEDLKDLESSLEIFSRKWQPIIIYLILKKGDYNYSDLQSEIEGISGKVLSNNLDNLIDSGYINKEVVSESPKRVAYSPTPKTEDLETILDDLVRWEVRNSKDGSKILIVDDEQKLTDLFSKWLGEEFETVTANSGREAIKSLDDDIDLILLDRVMEELSGEETLKRIREILDCPVIMITAKEPELKLAELSVGDYITKPVKKEELLEKTKEQLSMDEMERKKKSLIRRKEILEETFPESQLEDEEKYLKLKQKINEL